MKGNELTLEEKYKILLRYVKNDFTAKYDTLVSIHESAENEVKSSKAEKILKKIGESNWLKKTEKRFNKSNDKLFDVVIHSNKKESEENEDTKYTWFDISCPHCHKTFICRSGGIGTHCYDYRIKDGGQIIGYLGEPSVLQCPECNKYFKDVTFKEETND